MTGTVGSRESLRLGVLDCCGCEGENGNEGIRRICSRMESPLGECSVVFSNRSYGFCEKFGVKGENMPDASCFSINLFSVTIGVMWNSSSRGLKERGLKVSGLKEGTP